jgi:hypothetical protein
VVGNTRKKGEFMRYTLIIEFSTNQLEWEDIYAKEDAIEYVLGRSMNGAGTDLTTMVRDVSFSFDNARGLNNAIAKVKKLKSMKAHKGLTYRVFDHNKIKQEK